MSITRTGPDALISVEQAAEILTMTKQTVRRRISDGSLPAYRIAGQPTIRVWRSDVEALLQPIPATARLERVQVRGGGE
jgi:excisionase family DNA binding protein